MIMQFLVVLKIQLISRFKIPFLSKYEVEILVQNLVGIQHPSLW